MLVDRHGKRVAYFFCVPSFMRYSFIMSTICRASFIILLVDHVLSGAYKQGSVFLDKTPNTCSQVKVSSCQIYANNSAV